MTIASTVTVGAAAPGRLYPVVWCGPEDMCLECLREQTQEAVALICALNQRVPEPAFDHLIIFNEPGSD